MGGVQGAPLVMTDFKLIGQAATVGVKLFQTFTVVGTQKILLYTVPTGKVLMMNNLFCFKISGVATYMFQYVDNPAGTRLADVNIVGAPGDYLALRTDGPIYLHAGDVVTAEVLITTQPLTLEASMFGVLFDYSG